MRNSNQLHIATCLENELGSLKLVHFETVGLNKGPHNKHLQNSVLSLSIFFLDILKVRMPYYNNSSKKFCLYMKHRHCLYNTLRVTETGHSRINIFLKATWIHWSVISADSAFQKVYVNTVLNRKKLKFAQIFRKCCFYLQQKHLGHQDGIYVMGMYTLGSRSGMWVMIGH